jgi:hypothetical protein
VERLGRKLQIIMKNAVFWEARLLREEGLV